jgi:hypothetical protein
LFLLGTNCSRLGRFVGSIGSRGFDAVSGYKCWVWNGLWGFYVLGEIGNWLPAGNGFLVEKCGRGMRA